IVIQCNISLLEMIMVQFEYIHHNMNGGGNMKDNELVRFGVSMPHDLAEQFDRLIEVQGYGSRSEAIRDLVRKELLRPERLSPSEEVAGTIVIVYDHHVSDVSKQMTELQHS